VDIERKEFRITIKKEKRANRARDIVTIPAQMPINMAPATINAPAPAAVAPVAKEEIKPAASAEDKYITVKSPIIGTFYRSAGPDDDSFVSVGDSIKPGTTVCIVEAMKLFNEIESEISGTIVKVLVDDSTPVEYDQPLFLVDPS
jgi:acetyl-CoA carboxylase biotin carboxyl carrier protein